MLTNAGSKPLSAFAARQARQSNQARQRVEQLPLENVETLSDRDEDLISDPEAVKNATAPSRDVSHTKNRHQAVGRRAKKQRTHGEHRATFNDELTYRADKRVTPVESIDSLEYEPLESEGSIYHYSSDTTDERTAESTVAARPNGSLARILSDTASGIGVSEYGRGAIKVSLQTGSEIAVIGQFTLWLRKGFVSVLGALLRPSPVLYTVHAPATHALPIIKHVRPPSGFTTQDAEFIIGSNYSGLRALSRLHPNFRDIWNRQDGSSRSFSHLPSSGDDREGRSLNPFQEHEDWPRVALQISRAAHGSPLVLVCGPKNAGKSSFARYLVNKLLTLPRQSDTQSGELHYMDLDPGQPEYSAPGDISLVSVKEVNLGPSFSHPVALAGQPNTVLRAHHIGDYTPANDIDHYLASIKDLFAHHYHHFQDRQLIVNSCGWTQGAGLEIMEDILSTIQFTDIVLFNSSESEALPGTEELAKMIYRLKEKTTCAIHELKHERFPSRPARDLRLMQCMSYFHSDEPVAGQGRWKHEPLDFDSGQALSYGDSKADIQAIVVYGNRINPDILPTIISGSILALVEIEDTAMLESSRQAPSSALPYLFLGDGHTSDPLPPRTTRCIAQLLLRSIDPITRTLHVLTPHPLEPLIVSVRARSHSLALVSSRLQAPHWAYTEARHAAQASARDAAAWVAFRQSKIRAAGGTVTEDGVRGPGGEDWTDVEPLDLRVAGEEEFGAGEWNSEAWAAGQPWVELKGREEQGKASGGERKWRVRRNLGRPR